MDAVAAVPSRHPWLDRLIAAPEAEVRALVEGTAEIHPFRRAEPSDAAATLLFGLGEDDPAVKAFDQGALQTLVQFRSLTGKADRDERDRVALAALDLLTVIQRLAPHDTVIDLHRRFPYWNAWAETLVLDRGLDLRREYWRILALTQEEAKSAGLAARRLLPFWLDICGESGRRGRYDESYLTVGLVGLRSLPLSNDDSANEEAALHGLARWADAQRPDKRRFLREWHVLEGAFPHVPTFWTDLVARVLASVEDEIARKSKGERSFFSAAEWWREDVEAVKGQAIQLSDAIAPAAQSEWTAILNDIQKGHSIEVLAPRIDEVVRKNERYATRTGDTFYLVRTACNIGKRLLDSGDEPYRRAAKARKLAQLALRFEGTNVFAWSLWRDALAAEGYLEAAELIGWETIRRFPENPQWRNQLALLLSNQLDRAEEAEALLKETITLFPYDQKNCVVAHTQLADIIGRETVRLKEALTILDAALKIEPDGEVAQTMKARFEQGKVSNARQPAKRGPFPAPSIEVPDLPAELLALGRMRRTLFRARTTTGGGSEAVKKEVEAALSQDENLAYARYIAAAAGVSTSATDDSVIAAAYLAAAREGSAAALHTLIQRAHGVEQMIISMASATQDNEPATNALNKWIGEPANDLSPRDLGLRLIAARASKAPLSTEFIGDMLAASLGTALVA